MLLSSTLCDLPHIHGSLEEELCSITKGRQREQAVDWLYQQADTNGLVDGAETQWYT